MLIGAISLFLSLTTALTGDARHEAAHRACEVGLYALVSPEADEDEATPIGESLASVLCRSDDPGAAYYGADPDAPNPASWPAAVRDLQSTYPLLWQTSISL